MAVWEKSNSVLTDIGMTVLNNLQVGKGSLNISKVVAGAGKVALEENLHTAIEVTDPRATFEVVNKSATVQGSIIDIQLDNESVASSFGLWQIGVYVTHPDFGEVLYWIAQATTPDEVPAFSDTPAIFNYSLYLMHSNVTDVQVEITPANTVTQTQFTNHVENVGYHNYIFDVIPVTPNSSILTVDSKNLPLTLRDGMSFYARFYSDIPNNATLKINAVGDAIPIYSANGEPVSDAMLTADSIGLMVYSQPTNRWYLSGGGGSADIEQVQEVKVDLNEIKQKLANIESTMGTPNDTGGTTTTGSLFAKAKAAYQGLSELEEILKGI